MTHDTTNSSARFAGRTVLITGGASGMGYAAAELFLAEGANVVLTGRRAGRLEDAAARLGAPGRVLTVPADVARPADLDRVMEAVRERFGHLDVVFANAGVGVFKPVEEFTEEDVDLVLDVNVKGVLYTVQRSLPLLRDGGAIVVNASWTMHRGLPTGSVYAASKAAVGSLTRTLAADLAGRRIRVNSVSPGYIETEMYHENVTTDEARADSARQSVLGRVGTPEEVAQAVAYLASDAASFVNGADLLVDGGVVTAIPAS
ncbi:oxidoreductase [Streptomyces mashuensis]|uniref:Oxidoreductase n=1 Tax=Streptomyces mashuensis TaxID=33904 RepID=A0A919E9Y3_9ACTN|nr:glucose 1-dehydrogenase [Streptomyces mashuensis]GHF28738.1 oxidoreductase [Streptomyces mashuensis]